MSVDWDRLPLLALKCLLEHLSPDDAICAMSVSRHWRSAILLYEGYMDTLTLRSKNLLEQNLFLTRLFKKRVKKLHIYLDGNARELEKFVSTVLPHYFDSANLQEVVIVAPSYIHQNRPSVPIIKIKRTIIESLLLKHTHSMRKVALLGCEMDTATPSDLYTYSHMRARCRQMSFNTEPLSADSILSNCNTGLMRFSHIRHIITDYENLSTEALQTLSHLQMLTQLTLSVFVKRSPASLTRINWYALQSLYPQGLDVAIVVVAVNIRRFNEIMRNVLIEGLMLTSLKILFCKTLYPPLLAHVVRLFKGTLRELVWADCAHDSLDAQQRYMRPDARTQYDTCNTNPFVLICWQCRELRRLVIHGYWLWQYDILGFVRLRKTLEHLEISAVYSAPERFPGQRGDTDTIVRVLSIDSPAAMDPEYIQEVNDFRQCKWRPTPWDELHPGLRMRSTAKQRADYVVRELTELHPAASRVMDEQ